MLEVDSEKVVDEVVEQVVVIMDDEVREGMVLDDLTPQNLIDELDELDEVDDEEVVDDFEYIIDETDEMVEV